MAELYFDAVADVTLTSLENDPGKQHLAARVEDVLRALEDDPGQQSVRRRRFQSGLWCVVVAGNNQEWAILWEPHPTDPDGVVVQYIGPASFT